MTELYMAKTDLLADSVLYQELNQSLPKWRKEKAERLRYLPERKCSVLAWHILNHAVERRGFTQQQLEVSFHSSGKPYFMQLPQVFFNLSHSGSRVFCAVSNCEVGCDVERKRDIDLKLAERVFSEKEREYLMSFTDADIQRHTFFRLWTLKESIVKAMGSSVLAMRELTVNLAESPVSAELNQVITHPLFLHEFDFGDDYCYGCCTSEADTTVIHEVDISQLV